ncbi:MAG: single-stranded DNA-binding protein [Clostridia bacterium]|nr:single-stranded DNA-binding protein [Clostridia bacterium]
MNSIYEKNNVAHISGKVAEEPQFSHLILGEGFYNLNLEVIRLSEEVDILPVTVSERLLESGVAEVGNYIKIKGQLRSYNSYQNRKNHLILTVFARDIEKVEEEEAANSPNQICLNGYVCRTPVYRTTPFGREIADILLAVNRSYNKSDYIPCITWGRNAKYTSKLNVGDNIKVLGRIQSRNYQKKLEDGSVITKTAYEVSVSKVEICKKAEE